MALFKKLAIALLASIFLIGCGGSTPEDSVESFLYAAKDGDVDKLRKYSTDSTMSLLAMGLSLQCKGLNLQKKNDFNKCLKKVYGKFDSFKTVSTTINQNDKTKAVVVVEEKTKDGKIVKESIKVEKFEDDWKVNITK